MPGPGGYGGGPRGRHRGPGGGPHRPMGGPPPRHRYGPRWGGYRQSYRPGCLGGCLTLLLGCGGLFAFFLFAISSIF